MICFLSGHIYFDLAFQYAVNLLRRSGPCFRWWRCTLFGFMRAGPSPEYINLPYLTSPSSVWLRTNCSPRSGALYYFSIRSTTHLLPNGSHSPVVAGPQLVDRATQSPSPASATASSTPTSSADSMPRFGKREER
jgi:hypothetical protein